MATGPRSSGPLWWVAVHVAISSSFLLLRQASGPRSSGAGPAQAALSAVVASGERPTLKRPSLPSLRRASGPRSSGPLCRRCVGRAAHAQAALSAVVASGDWPTLKRPPLPSLRRATGPRSSGPLCRRCVGRAAPRLLVVDFDRDLGCAHGGCIVVGCASGDRQANA